MMDNVIMMQKMYPDEIVICNKRTNSHKMFTIDRFKATFLYESFKSGIKKDGLIIFNDNYAIFSNSRFKIKNENDFLIIFIFL